MTTTTVQIPLVALAVGSHEYGPAPVDDAVTTVVITVDRTVTKGGTVGLNGQPASTVVELVIWQSDDGGNNWDYRASATFIGGLYPSNQAGDPYLIGNLTVGLNPTIGRRVKANVNVAGANVAVAGSLVIF